MSKNNNNEKSPVISIIIVSVLVLGLGYFLFKSSPDNSQAKQNVANSTSVNVDSMHGGGAALNSDGLNSLVGKPLPDIQLADKDGKTYTTSDFKGKTTVLFFNEGLMCYPACWNQMVAFGTDPRFNSVDISAVSIVVDSPEDWQQAITKMPDLEKTTTLFDARALVSQKLGMLTTASSMHRGSLPGHTYVVVDKEGVVRYVFDDPNMAPGNDMLFAKIGELSNQ